MRTMCLACAPPRRHGTRTVCLAGAQHVHRMCTACHSCFTQSRRRRWMRRPRRRRRALHGRRRRRRRWRCARLQHADPHPPPTRHAPPPARSASRSYCPPAGPGFSTRPSLSATSRYPSQAEARSWAAAEAAEAAAAQLRAARRDAAEEKDAALQAVSDMRAQMVAQQAAAEAALLDAASRRVAYVESRSLSVTGVAGPARPSRVHRWHWATPSGLPGVVASPSFSTPLSNSRRPLLRRPARIATLRQS
jgi:hypothetical protein